MKVIDWVYLTYTHWELWCSFVKIVHFRWYSPFQESEFKNKKDFQQIENDALCEEPQAVPNYRAFSAFALDCLKRFDTKIQFYGNGLTR